MPANSGPSAGAGLRANAFGRMGARLNVVNGVTKNYSQTVYGGSGPASVATIGRARSGGPSFTTTLQRPIRPFSQRFGITGTTYDSVGAALANATVLLLDRAHGTVVAETISNGSGVFSFTVDDNSTERWGIAAGSGVAGATIGPLTYTVV